MISTGARTKNKQGARVPPSRWWCTVASAHDGERSLNDALAVVVSLQGYMLQRFLTFHLGRRREAAARVAAAEAEAKKAKLDKKKAQKAAAIKKSSEEEISELPEVDQNTSKSLKKLKTK